MYSDESWLQQVPYQADCSSSWSLHRFPGHDEPEHGLFDASYGFQFNGYDSWREGCLDADANAQSESSVHTSPEVRYLNAASSDEDIESLFVDANLPIVAAGVPSSLQWHTEVEGMMGNMSTAHSDFFALDLGVGFGPSNDVLPVSDDNFGMPGGPSDVQVPSSTPSPSLTRADKRSPTSAPSAPSRIEKNTKTFHFVANSDKKTATRLRNTMTSRNLRQSKVSRIAELEKALEAQQAETEKWRQRALLAGWKGSD